MKVLQRLLCFSLVMLKTLPTPSEAAKSALIDVGV